MLEIPRDERNALCSLRSAWGYTSQYIILWFKALYLGARLVRVGLVMAAFPNSLFIASVPMQATVHVGRTKDNLWESFLPFQTWNLGHQAWQETPFSHWTILSALCQSILMIEREAECQRCQWGTPLGSCPRRCFHRLTERERYSLTWTRPSDASGETRKRKKTSTTQQQ